MTYLAFILLATLAVCVIVFWFTMAKALKLGELQQRRWRQEYELLQRTLGTDEDEDDDTKTWPAPPEARA